MGKSISRRYYNNKSRIKTVGYYLGALQDVHVIEKLTNDGSVIIGIIVRAKTLEIVPVSLPIDRNGLVYCTLMTGICLHHLEYAEHQFSQGNITQRPQPKPLPKRLRSKKKTPKPLSPEQMGAISLLEQGVKVREIVAATGLTRNKIYVLKRKFT